MTGSDSDSVALELPRKRGGGERENSQRNREAAAGPLHTHLFSFTWRMIKMQALSVYPLLVDNYDDDDDVGLSSSKFFIDFSSRKTSKNSRYDVDFHS